MRCLALLALVALAGCPDPASPPPPRADAGQDATPTLDAAVDMAGDMLADMAGDMTVQMEVDAAPPPLPCEQVEALADVATAVEDGFVFEDITRDDDGGNGTCGGYGADRILRFTAPTAGVWRAYVEATIPGYEPVIHARSVCDDPRTERACRDEIPGAPGAAIHLALDAGESVFLFIDADNARGGFFRLSVAPVEAVEEACDPAGLANSCGVDSECRDGACAPRSIPVLDAVQIWRQPSGRFGMIFTGRDAGADAVAFLLDPVGRAVPDVPPSRLTVRDLPGLSTWSLGFRVNTPGYFASAHRMRVAVTDAQDHLSDWIEVPINASALAEPGEKCDRVRRPCVAGGLCQGGVCVTPARPTIYAAAAILNPDDPAIAINATVNRDAQVRSIEVELLDVEGVRIERFELDVDAGLPSLTRLSVHATRRLDLEPPVAATSARLTPVGATGWTGDAVDVELAFAEARAEGAACDPERARSQCPAETTCFERTCSPVTTECPADWAPILVEGDGPWRVIGTLGAETIETRPSCGGGAHAVAHVFDAPEDGEYLITAYSGELSGDPVLAIRSHCGYDGRTHPEFELACNDDALRLNARLVIELSAGQRIYPIVDGHGDWRGRYVLLIQRRQQ